jgi:hypothetical protein
MVDRTWPIASSTQNSPPGIRYEQPPANMIFWA